MNIQAIKNNLQQMSEQLLAIGETSKFLSVSITTLRRWDKNGRLKPIRFHPRSKRYYRKSDLMFFIQKGSNISNLNNLEDDLVASLQHVIKLRKFGTDLISAHDGQKAWKDFAIHLPNMGIADTIVIDFEGVEDFSEDWAEEFLLPLHEIYGDSMSIVNIDVANIGFLTDLELLGIYKHPYDLAR